MSSIDRRAQAATGAAQARVVASRASLVFAVGVALGQALNDNPQPGSTTTHDQTFTLPPESATVTVTTP